MRLSSYTWDVDQVSSLLFPKYCIKQLPNMASKVHSRPIGFLEFIKHMLKPGKDQVGGCPTSPNQRCNTNLVTADSLASAQTVESTGLEPETPGHSEKFKPSLWDRAYDGLKETDGQLVEEYEKLLSTQLQTNTGQKPCIPMARSKFNS